MMTFWTNLCTVEQEHAQLNTSCNIISQFKDSLMPIIYQALCITEFADDDDAVEDSPDDIEWTVSRATGAFMVEIAAVLGDSIVNETLQFAYTKLQAQSWQEHFVGLIALGSITEGPSPDIITKEFDPAYPTIVQMLSTSHSSRVRFAAAWLIA